MSNREEIAKRMAQARMDQEANGYNPFPAAHEYTGRGANQKEYAEVEENLKKHGENREPIYNKKHDLYE